MEECEHSDIYTRVTRQRRERERKESVRKAVLISALILFAAAKCAFCLYRKD